jgi:hypothetical protein
VDFLKPHPKMNYRQEAAMIMNLFFGQEDFAEIFDPIDEIESESNFHSQKDAEEIDVFSNEYIESMYYKIFGTANFKVVPERDLDIIKTYCNDKSLERAISVCHRLLQDFSEQKSKISNVISMDTKIIIDSHNTLLDLKVPHIYKPGMLILKVLYRDGNA